MLPVTTHLQVVVVGVLSQAPVEEGPGEVVHSILLAGDGLVHNLSHHVIMQEVVQVALHRVWLKQELLVVLLAGRVAHQHAPAARTAGLRDTTQAEQKMRLQQQEHLQSQQQGQVSEITHRQDRRYTCSSRSNQSIPGEPCWSLFQLVCRIFG